MISRLTTTALLAAALLSSGCSVINAYEDPTLVGKWQGRGVSDPNNEMDIDLDGEGDATIFTTAGSFTVDIKWEYKSETKYKLELECTSGCTNFDIECKEKSDGDRLECEDDAGAILEWKRD